MQGLEESDECVIFEASMLLETNALRDKSKLVQEIGLKIFCEPEYLIASIIKPIKQRNRSKKT